jgi:hypothetical protein
MKKDFTEWYNTHYQLLKDEAKKNDGSDNCKNAVIEIIDKVDDYVIEDNQKEDFKKNTLEWLKKDFSDKIEKKGSLSYVSWSDIWEFALKIDPFVKYRKIHPENSIIYFSDEKMGSIIKTEITLLGVTRECELPIMDFRNKPILKDSITVMDINKTYQRCLVKNLAMFGIGLHIYQGEDINENTIEENKKQKNEKKDLLKSLKEENKDFLGIKENKDILNSCIQEKLTTYQLKERIPNCPDGVIRLYEVQMEILKLKEKNEVSRNNVK